MPPIKVVFYQDGNNKAPVLEWLRSLSPKAQDKCIVKIERLAALGHELRRPEADYLRDKIYELRIGLQGINYRILYFFHENQAAVLAVGIIKEKKVPPADIDKAIECRKQFEQNPEIHSYQRSKND
jgi:hypothetical protein